MAKQHFKTLDGLRGVAALTVLAGHASLFAFGQSLVDRKLLAVQFFFMLSGFVIAYSYEAKLREGMRLSDFGMRRLIRLYPMIFVGAALGLLSQWPHTLQAGAALIYRAGFAAADLPCPTCGLIAPFPVNPPEWSIFFELIAYSLFAVVLYRLGSRALIVLAAALMAGASYAAIVYTDHVPFVWHFVDATGSFTVGMLLFRLRSRREIVVPAANLLTLGLVLVAICVASRALGPAIDVLAMLALFPMIILAGSRARSQAQPVAARLGDLSYPLYIVHWPILAIVHRAGLVPRLELATACSLAIVSAQVALILYDGPLRRRLTAWWRGKASPAVPA